MRSVAVQPEALKETDDAVAWYEDKEIGLGLRFLHDLDVLYSAIARRPETFQPIRSGFRRALMQKFPYAVFFEFTASWVVIHSVFHCSRNPTAWQKRMTVAKKKL